MGHAGAKPLDVRLSQGWGLLSRRSVVAIVGWLGSHLQDYWLTRVAADGCSACPVVRWSLHRRH
jgi:hypothetical protein